MFFHSKVSPQRVLEPKMTGDRSFPADELAAFKQAREFATFADAVGEWLSIDKDAAQFMLDFEALAWVVSSPEFEKASLARSQGTGSRLARRKGGAALPFGPLRRMARRLGLTPLRFLVSAGSPKGKSAFRMVIRHRFDSEFASGNHHKDYAERALLIEFGNLVLKIEQDGGISRSEARRRAAEKLRIERSERSLERWFAEFVALAEAAGYVPPPFEWAGSKPEFMLVDLYPMGSAKRQK
jgi:hypothetical protein